MVKSTKIHDQEQALSVYFKDMLGEQALTSTQTVALPGTESETIETPSVITEQTVPIAEETEAVPEGDIRLLLFKTAGMELAIPVSELNNIVRWPDKALTKIPGKAPWALGIYSNMGNHTEVVDIQAVISPKQTPDATSTKFAYIMLVDDLKWGIACEHIRQIINIPQKEVNWRQDKEKRPWFKGIVNKNMSSILDINAVISKLQNK